MFDDLESLSEADLANLMENAQNALKKKQRSKRREVYAKIKEMAASVGATVNIVEETPTIPTRPAGSVVPPKYRNPHDPSQTWTGRGVKPRWMQALVDQGRDPSEFLI